jgi:hypothetical protein
VVRGGDLGVIQHVNDRGDRGECPGSLGCAFGGIGQFDPGSVFGDGDRRDGELILVKGDVPAFLGLLGCPARVLVDVVGCVAEDVDPGIRAVQCSVVADAAAGDLGGVVADGGPEDEVHRGVVAVVDAAAVSG